MIFRGFLNRWIAKLERGTRSKTHLYAYANGASKLKLQKDIFNRILKDLFNGILLDAVSKFFSSTLECKRIFFRYKQLYYRELSNCQI